jgi:hypothetical protein
MKEQLRVKDSQIESYKQQLDDQSGVTRAAITELLKMKNQVLRLRGAEREDEEKRQNWNVSAERSTDDGPHRAEERAQVDS